MRTTAREKMVITLLAMILALWIWNPPAAPTGAQASRLPAGSSTPATPPHNIETNGITTIFRIRWNSKYDGVYYVDTAGSEYEIEVNDNLSLTTPCDDPQLRKVILATVQYFVDKNNTAETPEAQRKR